MSRKRPGKKAPPAPPRSRSRLPLIVVIVILGVAGGLGAWWLLKRPTLAADDLRRVPPVIDASLRAASQFPPAEAAECVRCHQQQFDLWASSQHAHANRLVQHDLDGPAFKTAGVTIGQHQTTPLQRGHELAFRVREPNGAESLHRAEAVIGIAPLLQYLVSAPGGRMQTMDAAWDPARREFFNVFGEERFAHEWGSWRNRGMTWNVQCASCHTTALRRNYEVATDTYRTTWKAMGISCSQCHGEMPQHRAHPSEPISPAEKLSPTQVMENCASCHSRREELTTAFVTGQPYLDHYRPATVDTTDIYFPDGQVRDEDFEYGSFLLSKMHSKGVVCLDCHEPHSGKLRLPAENNATCLACHGGTGTRGAIPIVNPMEHSHHSVESPGNRCIECHMPVTRYMQRDPRRDHGFTTPDPLLTRELGIPNACNRCHQDKSTDWAIERSTEWYGAKLDRRSRERARIVGRVRRHDETVVPQLLQMAQTEELNGWRAALVALLAQYSAYPGVSSFLQESSTHPEALVRAAAVRASADTESGLTNYTPLQSDPVRLVRLDATWAALNRRSPVSLQARAELQTYIEANWEQPQGAARAAEFAMIERRPADAEAWARKMATWDHSPGAQVMLAQTLHAVGKTADAVTALREAIKMSPPNGDAYYTLALLLAEQGEKAEVPALLRKTVELEPGFARAWYNLGLALSESGDIPGSLDALARAEAAAPTSPDAPYARATVLARIGRVDEARTATEEALRRAPNYAPARELLSRFR